MTKHVGMLSFERSAIPPDPDFRVTKNSYLASVERLEASGHRALCVDELLCAIHALLATRNQPK